MIEKFGLRLSQLRDQKGISARDMSLSLGYSSGYINGVENQKSYPSMQSFLNICEFLEVTPVEFFDLENKCPTEYRELISDLNKLTPEMREHVEAIIKGLKK